MARIFKRDDLKADGPAFLAHYGERRPQWLCAGHPAALLAGDDVLAVVGELSYQEELWHIVGGRTDPAEHIRHEVQALLLAEPDNPYDANAVSVWIEGFRVGYLPRRNTERYLHGLLEQQRQRGQPIALAGEIVGGGIREDGPGRLGVFLDHDPADFGVRSR